MIVQEMKVHEEPLVTGYGYPGSSYKSRPDDKTEFQKDVSQELNFLAEHRVAPGDTISSTGKQALIILEIRDKDGESLKDKIVYYSGFPALVRAKGASLGQQVQGLWYSHAELDWTTHIKPTGNGESE